MTARSRRSGRSPFVRVAGVVAGGGALALFFACQVGDVDFDGKACPCGDGYTCDAARNVCVRPGAVIPDASGPTGDGAGQAPTNPDAGPGISVCAGAGCACTADKECVDPRWSHCSPQGVCVECLPSADTCSPGNYCNASNQCILGCKGEADCAASPIAPHCDATRHQCVACRTLADCTGADRCSPSGECVQGCDLDAGKLCAPGRTCCQGFCITTTTDPLNCGACGTACSLTNGTPACANSTCSWTCAAGFAHCGTANTGCESNTRTDVAHCGSCTVDCTPAVANATGPLCDAGTCSYATCTTGFDDCDKNPANGCECTCGQAHGQPCCPGRVCLFSGATCNGGNKCI